MTVDEIIDSIAGSCADDWAFWVYPCADSRGAARPPQEVGEVQERDFSSCARAVYLKQRAIGLIWWPASECGIAGQPALESAVADSESLHHWVGLLYQGAVVDRHLAAWVDEGRASLPVPFKEPRGDGGGATLWVSRRAHRLLRLANEVDPDCSDFDDRFAALGIELR